MSETLHVRATMTVHDGKLNALQQLLAEARPAALNNPGLLHYEFYLDAARTRCVSVEAYQNSEAALTHLVSMGEVVGKLMELVDIELEIYGDPSPALRDALAALEPEVYTAFVVGD